MLLISSLFIFSTWFANAQDETTDQPTQEVIAAPAETPQPVENVTLPKKMNANVLSTQPVLIRQTWRPKLMDNSIGYENATLDYNAISYSRWTNEKWGFDFLFGFQKSSDSFNKSETQSTDELAPSRNISTTYSGSKNQQIFTLGTVGKYRIFQNDWLRIYAGGYLGLRYFTDVKYKTGTTTQSISNLNSPDDYTVSESSLGKIKNSTDLEVFLGPKIGSEIYLRWFPHVALGFATGFLYTFGGETETISDTSSRNYAVVAGVAQTPTAKSNNRTKTVRKPDGRGGVFGIGGTAFNLFGSWTIRYVW